MKRVAAAITGCLLALAPAAEGSVLDGHTANDAAAGATSSHEETLREKLRNPPPGGWLLVVDRPPGHWHHDLVVSQAIEMGMEDENILSDPSLRGVPWYADFFDENGIYAGRWDSIKVVNMSWTVPFREEGTAELVAKHNVLFVNSAGNTLYFPEGHRKAGLPDPSKRDRYTQDGYVRPDGRQWADLVGGVATYDETMAVLATGKAILAKWATVNAKGDTVLHAGSVKCGNARESCFTLVLPPEWQSWEQAGTSYAAPRLSAYAFYLSQLWPKAEQVTQTLRDCAMDIGEPGPDDEFGQGIISDEAVDCGRVRREEKSVASASVEVDSDSPTLVSIMGNTSVSASFSGAGLSLPVMRKDSMGASLLLTRNYRALSLSADIGKTKTLLSIGTGTQPLGVSSVFLPQSRKPFLEIGATREFHFTNGLSASFLGAHGRSNDFSVTRLGVSFRAGKLPLSVYTGASLALALADIPGREAAGRPLIPVRKLSPEFRLRWDLPLPESGRVASRRR